MTDHAELDACLSRIYLEYAHHVRVNITQDAEWDLMFHWLTQHVGVRRVNWEWPTSGVFVFKHAHDACLFSLTWSGS